MSKFNKFGKIITLILFSTLLISCGEGSKKVEEKTVATQTKTEEKSTEIPKEKNQITIGVTSFADTLEPTEQYFSWVISRYGIGETLTKFDIDGHITSSLAESWEHNETGDKWRFKIRKGVKFSDGTEMTPESVKSSLERTFSMSKRAETYFRPKSIEVDGDYLVITNEAPNTTLAGSLADPLFIIINTKTDTSKIAMEGPICTGPYMVEKFNPTEYCIVRKNPHYWGGEVPFEKVNFKCINDQATRSMAMQSGEIQMAYNLKTENLIDFQDSEKYNIQSLESLRTTYAFMNENGVLKDKALRQAINRALNKEVYCKVLLAGGATPGKAPVPPTLDFGFDELVDENSYNPESAKQILVEAGYRDVDGDGYVETPDEKKLVLDFVIYTSREELKIYAQAAQISLKEVGINVKINTVSYETLLDFRDAGKFDLLIWNVLVANTGDPEKYLRENWYSKSISNQTGYNNPKVDELLDRLEKEFDPAKRRELTIEIQQLIMDDIPTIFFGYETTYLISSQELKNVEIFPMDYYWMTNKISFK